MLPVARDIKASSQKRRRPKPSMLRISSPAPLAPLSSSSSESAGLAVQARAASAKGDTDLALRLAQAAIVADPSRPSSYDLLGDVYAADHQGDAARYYYDQALAIDPADNAAIKAIAALDRAGDTRKADASDGAKPGIP